MKKKFFLIILFLILAIFLVGCSGVGIITPATDEVKIKIVINEFCLALNDQNWSKAKGYCVYGSEKYYAIDELANIISIGNTLCNDSTLNISTDILDVSINGNYAQVYCYTTTSISICGESESASMYGNLQLQKVGMDENWELY